MEGRGENTRRVAKIQDRPPVSHLGHQPALYLRNLPTLYLDHFFFCILYPSFNFILWFYAYFNFPVLATQKKRLTGLSCVRVLCQFRRNVASTRRFNCHVHQYFLSVTWTRASLPLHWLTWRKTHTIRRKGMPRTRRNLHCRLEISCREGYILQFCASVKIPEPSRLWNSS